MLHRRSFVLAAVLLTAFGAAPAHAQLVISANDGAAVLVNGVNTVPSPPQPDSVTIFDASVLPPRVVSELPVANSVIGPPQNVAIAPDGSIAVVTSSTKIDPADPARTVNDDTVTVIDLRRSPAAVLTSMRAGAMASGASFSPDGRLVLVANRGEGTVSVFTAEGTTVRYEGRDVVAGLKPYAIDITPDGALAVVGSTGSGTTGSVDTVALVDLTLDTPRTIQYVTVGVVAEALGISPDGRFVAVTVMNGTNAVPGSPIYNDFGRLRVYAIVNRALTPITEARIGNWCQGVVWPTPTTILAQCMTERQIQTFRFDGTTLSPAGVVRLGAGPAGIAVHRP